MGHVHVLAAIAILPKLADREKINFNKLQGGQDTSLVRDSSDGGMTGRWLAAEATGEKTSFRAADWLL